MRLIVTGGAGFIGSAAVCRAVQDGHTVLTIDKLTYAGRLEALSEVSRSPHHRFLQADIADSAAMTTAFAEFEPDAVLHLAARVTSIDRSTVRILLSIQTYTALSYCLRQRFNIGCDNATPMAGNFASSTSRPMRFSVHLQRMAVSTSTAATLPTPRMPPAKLPPTILREPGTGPTVCL